MLRHSHNLQRYSNLNDHVSKTMTDAIANGSTKLWEKQKWEKIKIICGGSFQPGDPLYPGLPQCQLFFIKFMIFNTSIVIHGHSVEEQVLFSILEHTMYYGVALSCFAKSSFFCGILFLSKIADKSAKHFIWSVAFLSYIII